MTTVGVVLVTGATGFVGRAVTARLVAAGVEVRGTVRDADRIQLLQPGVVPCVTGDLVRGVEWESSLDGVASVIHLAARVHVMHDSAGEPDRRDREMNVDVTAHLAKAAAACGVGRMIYLSSVKIHGEGGPRTLSETDPPAPADSYARSKLAAEKSLTAIASRTGLECVILRPPLVYGPGVGGNFRRLLKLADLSSRVPLPLGGLSNQRSMIHVQNLADILVCAALNARTVRGTYLVADDEALSTSKLIEHLAAGLGHRARLFRVPPAMIQFAAGMLGWGAEVTRLTGSLTVDTTAVQHAMRWQPPVSVIDGLAETARWWRARSGRLA